ncbi:hypothetical protein HMPREF9419_2229 [Prevotella nigrescens ATCC 33563]|nr:hypothetical protein HMPREF9419_2229 [Prevotella nigrescens ATCC 33563]
MLCKYIVVIDTTKIQLFKQITTRSRIGIIPSQVVIDTTKIQLFKQITTSYCFDAFKTML